MDLIFLAVLGLSSVLKLCDAENMTNASKPAANSRRTHDLVDEAFLEQKDILLDMLETKLKEVRDKKKKKTVDRSDPNTINAESKCDPVPKTGELKLSASGISAVGEVDAHLRFGESGRGTLKLNATGISNVGRSNLDLGVADGNVHIPGISNLFTGNILSNNCEKQAKDEPESEIKNSVTEIVKRRNKTDTALNDTIANTTKTENSGDINVPTAANTVKNVNETVKINITAPSETVNAVV